MSKKGSMELSVNSIVILVIAVVMLGLILGFVKSKFSDLDKQLVTSEPDAPTATASNPLSISRETIAVSPGEEIVLKVNVFAIRQFNAPVATGVQPPSTMLGPNISCSSGNGNFNLTKYVYQGKMIPAGENGAFVITATVPQVPRGKYLCTLKVDVTAVPAAAGVPAQSAINLTKDILFDVRA